MLQPDGSVVFPICLSPSDHGGKARQLQRVKSSTWAGGVTSALVAAVVWYLLRICSSGLKLG